MPWQCSLINNQSGLPFTEIAARFQIQSVQAWRIRPVSAALSMRQSPGTTIGAEVQHEGPLHHQRKNLRRPSPLQISPFPVRSPLGQRQSTLINRIDLAGLRP